MDLVLQQPTEFLFDTEKQDIFLPGSLVEFPYVVEALPFWISLGSFGGVVAHELAHAFTTAVKDFAHNFAGPANISRAFYYTKYTVRYFGPIIIFITLTNPNIACSGSERNSHGS